MPQDSQFTQMSQAAPYQQPALKSKDAAKNLLPITIILGILAAASIGTNIYAFIQNDNKDAEISRLSSQLDKDQTPNNIQAETLLSVPGNLLLSSHQCLNSDESLIYNPVVSTNDGIVQVVWDTSNNSGHVSVRWQDVGYYGLESEKDRTDYDIDIKPFDSNTKVTDVYIQTIGVDSTYATIFYLMEDGTVEYTPLLKALKEGEFRSYGKLDGVEGVVKLYSIGFSLKDFPTGGGITVVAQRADGNFYDLRQLIINTNNYPNILQ